MDLPDRIEKFSKEVQAVGGTIYTPLMLQRFTEHWTEPDRAKKPKMRFEKQKTWKTAGRLRVWSQKNYDRIVCFLTDSERTVAEKKREFVKHLEPYRATYSREILNGFYRHWSQPENKRGAQYLRWELEEFWDVGTRLAAWAERENKLNGPTKH